MSKDLVIQLSQYGPTLGQRDIARKLCSEAIHHARQPDNFKVIIDLRGITTISSGFAYELFGKLKNEFQTNFGEKIKIIFSDDQIEQNRQAAMIESALETKHS